MTSTILPQKPIVEFYLDPDYTSWVKAFNTSRIYKGYRKILDPQNQAWWSDIQIRPLAVFYNHQDGDFFLESNYALHRVIFQEFTPEMEAHLSYSV